MDIPHADLQPDVRLVERLIAAQAPRFAASVALVGEGWDNTIFRLGEQYAVRMPRRTVAAQLIEHEQRWLPELQSLVQVTLPVPAFAGRAGDGYPFAWSIVPWVDGVGGATLEPAVRDGYARALAGFVCELHRPAPATAPHNPVRGVPLATRTAALHRRLEGLRGRLSDGEIDALRALWDARAAAPAHAGPAVWLHGDLHAGNVVATTTDASPAGLAAVIDFGDLTAGDPATDLAAAWIHFTPAGRADFRAACAASGPVDERSWERAQAWALSIGSAALAASDGSGPMARMGRHTLAQLLAEA